jgi:hypothetical protein
LESGVQAALRQLGEQGSVGEVDFLHRSAPL